MNFHYFFKMQIYFCQIAEHCKKYHYTDIYENWHLILVFLLLHCEFLGNLFSFFYCIKWEDWLIRFLNSFPAFLLHGNQGRPLNSLLQPYIHMDKVPKRIIPGLTIPSLWVRQFGSLFPFRHQLNPRKHTFSMDPRLVLS